MKKTIISSADNKRAMRIVIGFGLVLAIVNLESQSLHAGVVSLGAANNYAVLAGSTITSTGATVINGGLGLTPGSAVTGSPTVNGLYDVDDAPAILAQNDLATAYNTAAGLAPNQNLTGQDLGGLTLTPGVYFFSSSAQLTGTLTLNYQGNPNAYFVFQIGSTLTTASHSSVVAINNNGFNTPGASTFWQVGSSATLGTTTAFEGNILALTSITADTGATVLDGRLLARNGAVTLDENTISYTSAVPEPAQVAASCMVLLGIGGIAMSRRFAAPNTIMPPTLPSLRN